jgi:hypothetical protein
MIATRAEGTAEILMPEFGRLVPERSAHAIAEAVRELAARAPDRARIRERAQQLAWGPPIAGLLALFEGIARGAKT